MVEHHIDIEKEILQGKVRHHMDIEKEIIDIEKEIIDTIQKEVDEIVKAMEELDEAYEERFGKGLKKVIEWKEKITKDMNLDSQAKDLKLKDYEEFETIVKKSKYYENIKKATKLSLYEYYDGIETKIDDNEMITINVKDIFPDRDNHRDNDGEFLLLFMHFIAFELHIFENLKNLTYTTRFGGETSYSPFLYKPNKLKEVTFEHTEGLDIRFIEGLRSFNQMRYTAQDYESGED